MESPSMHHNLLSMNNHPKSVELIEAARSNDGEV